MGDEAAITRTSQSLTETNAVEPLRSRDGSVEIVATHCADCGSELGGEYCTRCGQHRVEPPRTFWALMREWVSAYFNLEGKLWTTLRMLVQQPGELSIEYFRGKRTRYFPPLKLYLTMSVIFFSLAALRMYAAPPETPRETKAERRARLVEMLAEPENDLTDELEGEGEDKAAERQIAVMGLALEKASRAVGRARIKALDENRRLTPEERAALVKEIEDTKASTLVASKQLPSAMQGIAAALIDKTVEKATLQLDESLDEDANNTPKERVTRMIEDLAASSPKALFFFLPAFAGVYAWLFRKQSFYVESFVFTLHLHSFFFALAIVDLFIPSWPATFVMIIGMGVYTNLALRKVYAISRARAVTATIFATFAYMAIFAILNGLIREASLISCALGGKCV